MFLAFRLYPLPSLLASPWCFLSDWQQVLTRVFRSLRLVFQLSEAWGSDAQTRKTRETGLNVREQTEQRAWVFCADVQGEDLFIHSFVRWHRETLSDSVALALFSYFNSSYSDGHFTSVISTVFLLLRSFSCFKGTVQQVQVFSAVFRVSSRQKFLVQWRTCSFRCLWIWKVCRVVVCWEFRRLKKPEQSQQVMLLLTASYLLSLFHPQGAAGVLTSNDLPGNHGSWLKCEREDESDDFCPRAAERRRERERVIIYLSVFWADLDQDRGKSDEHFVFKHVLVKCNSWSCVVLLTCICSWC